MSTFPDLTNDELADQIVTWAGRVAAGEARQLALIAEFDRREGWAGPGLLSCAHWLSWRTGLGPAAARERVRVARALMELPLLREAFESGRISYAQIRAVTRVATPQDETTWVELARFTMASQLEKVVRGVRRARRVDEDAVDPERAAYRLRARTWYDDDGNMTLTVKAPAEDGAVLLAALDQVRAQLDQQRAADVSAETTCPQDGPAIAAPDEASPPRATEADALLEMARMTLDRQAVDHPTAARRARSALVAQVDPITGWGRLRDGELLPPTSLTRVLRTLPGRDGTVRLRPLTPADRAQHDLGRTQRLPSLRLRELLGTLDGERCRFPGCTRRRRLQAHHVVYWRDGGATDLANLVLICSRHHTLVHQGEFRLVLHDNRALSVSTAEGVPVLHHPALPWRAAEELEQGAVIAADTLPPEAVEARMDLAYVVSVLMQQAA